MSQTTPADNKTSTRLKLRSTGVTAYCTFGPALYFHPDSETLISVDACDKDAIEREHGRLEKLLATRIDAQLRIDDLTNRPGLVSCCRAEPPRITAKTGISTARQCYRSIAKRASGFDAGQSAPKGHTAGR